MDILLHMANVLYLISFLLRDMLWLRVLTVIASVLLIFFFWACPYPLLEAIAWNLVFMALNIYWIARLVIERRRRGVESRGSREGARIHLRPAGFSAR